MKRTLLVILLLGASALAQTGVRYGDSQPIRDSVTVSGVTGALVRIIANASINLCTAPANAVPCTNKATTYTDSTLLTPCSTATQVTLAGSTSCVGTTDSSGAWGVWAPAGQYEWTYTSNGASSGPFPATLGGSSSGGGSGGALLVAPPTTQVLKATAPNVQTVFQQPTGAAGTFAGFEFVTSAWVDDTTTPGEVSLAILQNKTSNFAGGAGSGTGISTGAYNNKIMADVMTGADAGAKIAAATALVSGGGIVDATGLLGAQTIGSSLSLATAGVTYLFGKATFTCGTGVSVQVSADNVRLVGQGPDATIFDCSGSTSTTGQHILLSGNNDYLGHVRINSNRITVCGIGTKCRIGGGGTHAASGVKIGVSAPSVIAGVMVEDVSVYNAGFIGLQMDNCAKCTFQNNYVEQSFGVAMQVNSSQTAFNTVYGYMVLNNRTTDTNVGCGLVASPDNCGDGQINIISNGGFGVLGKGLIQGNIIDNIHKTAWDGIPSHNICNTTTAACAAGPDAGHTCGGGGASDTACGQGIQQTYSSQYGDIKDNIINHTSHEAIATAGTTVTSGNHTFDNSCCSGGAGMISYYVDPGNEMAAAATISTISTTTNVITITTATALSLTHGSFIRVAGTSNYNGVYELTTENDGTKTYTVNCITSIGCALGSEATGTVQVVGVGRGAVIANNIGQDVGLGVSLQVGTNTQTNPDHAIFSGITVSGNSVAGILNKVQNAYQAINNCNVCSAHASTIDHVVFIGNTASGVVTNKFRGPQTTSFVGSFASGFPQLIGNTPATPTFTVLELAKGATALTNRSAFSDSTTTSLTEGAMTYRFCYDLKAVATQATTLAPTFTWTDENGNAKTYTGLSVNLASLTNAASRVSECFIVSDGTGDILYSIPDPAGAGRYDFKMSGNPDIQ